VADELRASLDRIVRDPSFLARWPYYAAILARIDPVADPSVESMAVSVQGAIGPGLPARFYLHVNVDRFVRAPEHLRGILLHEVHHVVLGHLTHPKFFDVAHPDLMELAQEMSANEHVEEPLPNPITWQAFKAVGVRAGQSTMQRYDALVAARAGGKPMPSMRDIRFVDGHLWQPGAKGGRPPPGGLEETRRLIERAIEEGPSPAEDEDAPRNAQLAGTTPGRLLEELMGVRGPPQKPLDWRTALEMFVAKERSPVHSYGRPSRRHPQRIGEVPGRSWSPRIVARPRIVVALDTSMSMSERELSEIARHLAPMSEHARLVIAECDVEIARAYPFDPSAGLGKVVGRGGTDLRPVFEPTFLRAQHADGVVYFTDGQGPFPERAPDVPVLWVLTKPLEFECPWGARAAIVRRG
jgi:predicted metal-dependent peptidase